MPNDKPAKLKNPKYKEERQTFLAATAKTAFDAYNKQAGGKTWDGKDIPPWESVGDQVQSNWVAAVKAILNVQDDDPEEV